jgi:ribose transport system permease protein
MSRISVSRLGFDRFSGLYVWALFIVVFGVLKPDLFLTTSNLQSIAVSQAVTAMIGMAVVLPLTAGVFDLSVGANVQFCAVFASLLQSTWGVAMWPSIAITMLAAVAIGVFNGVVVVVLRVSSVIATLAVATLLAAVQTIATNNLSPEPATSQAWINLTQSKILGFQSVFWILIVIGIALWWVLERMPAGRYMRAVGSNANAARLSGIRAGRYQFLSLVICSSVAGLAGICYASNIGPSLSFGGALLLPAYAAAFLGYTQITPGRFNIAGAFIAVYILATGVQGLAYLTNVQWLGDMFSGATLIAAVAFAEWRQRALKNKKARSDPHASTTPPSAPQQIIPRHRFPVGMRHPVKAARPASSAVQDRLSE